MDTSSTRRRLIKGSLAVPAVLTVSSASAQAWSSFGRCLRRSHLDQREPFFSVARDNMFRKKVEVVQLAHRGHVKGWYFLDQSRNVYVNVEPPHKALDFGRVLHPDWAVTGTGSRWALVWFDKGSTTQYSRISLQRPAGAVPATMSCYGSFAGGRA